MHVDVKRLARFHQPGHRATSDRREIARNRGVGYEYLHCVVDDHSRLAYVELHPREDTETAARVLERALAFFAELRLDPAERS
jgi:transposase